MINILFVCLGNICRSPMAEGIFNQLIKEQALESYFAIDSSGTANYHCGALPDDRMQAEALENKIVLTHEARQLIKNDLQIFDYIIAMDRSNYREILKLKNACLSSKSQVLLMREFDPDKDSEDVPDPYYGGKAGFTQVYDILKRSNMELLKFLVNKHIHI